MKSELSQGYKVTPLGIIPKEWEIYDFDKIVMRPQSRHLPNPQIHLRCIELEHLSQGGGSILGYIDSAEQKSMKNEFDEGDVLFGKLRPYLRKYWLAKFRGVCSTEIWVFRVMSDICTKEYLFNIVSSYNFIQKANVSSGSKMPRAEWDFVSKIPILTPPLSEQEKIAEILSTWDKAIEKQIQLIQKLELRKKGLMQQLLTAKRRLPGFSDPWKELKIRDIAKIRKGEQVNKEDLFSNAKYPVINGGITPSGYLDIYNTTANTITISEGGNSCGYVNFMTTPFWSGGHCYTIDVKDGINNLFVYQLLKHNEKYIMSLRVGSGLPNIQVKDFGNLKLAVPNNQEQTAIAQVLTAADREIELAQQKLELLRQQKRGLMQQLLTGKKRVKY